MSIEDLAWDALHPSAVIHARSKLRPVRAVARPHGALRFQCPESTSFVVVTDDRTLATLGRPRARLRCPSCGETHLLLLESPSEDTDAPPPDGDLTM